MYTLGCLQHLVPGDLGPDIFPPKFLCGQCAQCPLFINCITKLDIGILLQICKFWALQNPRLQAAENLSEKLHYTTISLLIIFLFTFVFYKSKKWWFYQHYKILCIPDQYVSSGCTDAGLLLIQKLYPAENCAFYNVEQLRIILSGQAEVLDKEYFIGIMPRYATGINHIDEVQWNII